MTGFDSCVAQGLLQRIAPSKTQAQEQMNKAHTLLLEAKTALENDMPNSAVISGYSAMLNAARSVLFMDGWRERSHACVVAYLREKYGKVIGSEKIDLFDEYRDKRHKTMYSGDYYPDAEEAQRIVEFADEFVMKIEMLKKS